jgi:probable HAF family extracellular repeat protein
MPKNLLLLMLTFAVLESAVSAQSPRHNQPPRYYIINLGAPLGGNPEPVGINNLGLISGGANLTGNTAVNAELWLGASFDLGTLGGLNSNIAWPNHTTTGEVVGIAETAEANPYHESWSCSAFFPSAPTGDVCLGFAWRNGVMTGLPPLPGGYDSYAAGVNNRGQVVGWAENSVLDPTCNNAPPVSQYLQFEAVVWGPGLNEITQLPPYPGDPDSAATAINERGQVIGISGICSNAVGGASAAHALLWENGKPVNLGNLGAQVWNTPISLNNRGQIVGFANNISNNSQGFLWTRANGMKALPYIGDDNAGAAYDINEKGQIVGISNGGTEPYGMRAFLYDHGKMLDLNTLVVGDSPLYLLLAQGINDKGEIVGTAAEPSGQQVGFLAIPVSGLPSRAATAQVARNQHAFDGRTGTRPHLVGFPRLLLQAQTE